MSQYSPPDSIMGAIQERVRLKELQSERYHARVVMEKLKAEIDSLKSNGPRAPLFPPAWTRAYTTAREQAITARIITYT